MKTGLRQSGFTLLEVAVSLLLLSVGMMAGLGMIRAGQLGVRSGYLTTRAVVLAQAVMEEKLSMPYRVLSEGETGGEDAADGFQRVWTARPEGAGFLVIRVRVEWKDSAGNPHGLTLAALRSEGAVP